MANTGGGQLPHLRQAQMPTTQPNERQTHLELPADEKFVQDVVRLVEIEDDVQLAHVPEVAVQHLHEEVDLLEGDELVVVLIYARYKKQGCVPVLKCSISFPPSAAPHIPGHPRGLDCFFFRFAVQVSALRACTFTPTAASSKTTIPRYHDNAEERRRMSNGRGGDKENVDRRVSQRSKVHN